MPSIGSGHGGPRGQSRQPIMGDGDRHAGGSRTPVIAGLAMAGRHGGRQHAVAVIKQVLSRQDRDFLPAIPVNMARWAESRGEPGLVKWDIFSRVFKELRKLATLVFKELPSRPILAFHQ